MIDFTTLVKTVDLGNIVLPSTSTKIGEIALEKGTWLITLSTLFDSGGLTGTKRLEVLQDGEVKSTLQLWGANLALSTSRQVYLQFSSAKTLEIRGYAEGQGANAYNTCITAVKVGE